MANDNNDVAAFLEFLAKDIERHPENLKPLTPALMRRVKKLVRGIKVDLDAPIDADFEF